MSDFWSRTITLLGASQLTVLQRKQTNAYGGGISGHAHGKIQNPYELKMVKFSNWKTPKHPILNRSNKPQQNYQEKLHPTLAFTMKG